MTINNYKIFFIMFLFLFVGQSYGQEDMLLYKFESKRILKAPQGNNMLSFRGGRSFEVWVNGKTKKFYSMGDTIIVTPNIDTNEYLHTSKGGLILGHIKSIKVPNKYIEYDYTGTNLEIEVVSDANKKQVIFKRKNGERVALQAFTMNAKDKDNKKGKFIKFEKKQGEKRVLVGFDIPVKHWDSDSILWDALTTDMKDARVAEGAGNNNYGATVTTNHGGLVGSQNSTWIQFPDWQSLILANQVIDSARIVFQQHGISGTPEVVIKAGDETFWLEGAKDGVVGVGQELTWNSNQPLSESPFSADTLGAANEGATGWVWDVTLMFQQDYDGTNVDSGKVMFEIGVDGANVQFKSSENATPELRPELRVYFSSIIGIPDAPIVLAISDSEVIVTLDDAVNDTSLVNYAIYDSITGGWITKAVNDTISDSTLTFQSELAWNDNSLISIDEYAYGNQTVRLSLQAFLRTDSSATAVRSAYGEGQLYPKPITILIDSSYFGYVKWDSLNWADNIATDACSIQIATSWNGKWLEQYTLVFANDTLTYAYGSYTDQMVLVPVNVVVSFVMRNSNQNGIWTDWYAITTTDGSPSSGGGGGTADGVIQGWISDSIVAHPAGEWSLADTNFVLENISDTINAIFDTTVTIMEYDTSGTFTQQKLNEIKVDRP